MCALLGVPWPQTSCGMSPSVRVACPVDSSLSRREATSALRPATSVGPWQKSSTNAFLSMLSRSMVMFRAEPRFDASSAVLSAFLFVYLKTKSLVVRAGGRAEQVVTQVCGVYVRQCVCECVFACARAWLCVHVHVHVHVHAHAQLNVNINDRARARSGACVHTYVHVCVLYVCVLCVCCVCVYVCVVCVVVCVCTRVHSCAREREHSWVCARLCARACAGQHAGVG